MKITAPFVLATLTTIVTLPLHAECGCANAPCEQTTLQSAFAREDLAGEFGASLSPVEVVAHSGSMSLEFSSVTDGSGAELAAAFFVALLLFPFAFAFGRLVAYNDRLVLLTIVTAEPTPRLSSALTRRANHRVAASRLGSGFVAPSLGAGAPPLGAFAPS